MSDALELLDHQFAFTQRPLLAVGEFRRECERRGVPLLDEHLEALYRAGVLVPLYRVAKDVRRGLTEARRRQLTWLPPSLGLGAVPTRGPGLRWARATGHLHAAASELYRPWHQFRRRFGSSTFRASEFLYSPYQLLAAHRLSAFVSRMRARRSGRASGRLTFTYRLASRTLTVPPLENIGQLVLPLSALEALYRPAILGRLCLPDALDEESWLRYREQFSPSAMLEWLGWDAGTVRETSERLLSTAYHLDPMREWLDVIRLAGPDKWAKLRGDALTAHEHRLAAEMLLRFYEDLVRAGMAERLEAPPGRMWHPLCERLNPEGLDLDAVLMEFGLSPHPALVLVLEGQTEWALMPRVFELLGIPQRENFIQIVDARGVARDLGLLAAYAAMPRLGETYGDTIALTRPPTRFLVAIDPEGKYATAEDRRDQREKWVKQLYDRVPEEHRTPTLRADLELLVEVETWGQGSFEFAHFTDEELASALLHLHSGQDPPTLPVLTAHLATIRRTSRNIEEVWKRWPQPRPTKLVLADRLWPLLVARIEAASSRADVDCIPIARIALRAGELARELPRASVVVRR